MHADRGQDSVCGTPAGLNDFAFKMVLQYTSYVVRRQDTFFPVQKLVKPFIAGIGCAQFEVYGAVSPGKVKGLSSVRVAHLIGMFLDVSGVLIPVFSRAVAVGYALCIFNPSGNPASVNRVQNPGFTGIGNQERIVVAEIHGHRGVAALSVGFKKVCDHVEGLICGFGPFQSQAYQVHARKAVFAFLLLT